MARFMNMGMNIDDEDEPRTVKLYKTRKNVLDTLDDDELYKRFRFNRESIKYICDLVRDDIEHETNHGGALSVETQVLATLVYMASNTFQLHLGDLLGISQQSISNCVAKVTKALAAKAGQFIYFPNTREERRQTINVFNSVAEFLNVVGLVDCTHIKILAPKNEIEREYVNRKSFHSINVQGIVDEKGRFINVVAKWPGCTHDSFILRQSQVWGAFETGQLQGYILGDSGYPCRRWLMTPFANPTTDGQKRYNLSHAKTRVQIEQVFGRLKRRFHSLHGELRIKLDNVPTFIVAACVLHNIAVDRNQPDFVNEDVFEEDQPDLDNLPNHHDNNGNAYRNQIVHDFFDL